MGLGKSQKKKIAWQSKTKNGTYLAMQYNTVQWPMHQFNSIGCRVFCRHGAWNFTWGFLAWGFMWGFFLFESRSESRNSRGIHVRTTGEVPVIERKHAKRPKPRPRPMTKESKWASCASSWEYYTIAINYQRNSPDKPPPETSVATVPGGDIAPWVQRPHDDMWMPLWICSQEKAHVSGEIY